MKVTKIAVLGDATTNLLVKDLEKLMGDQLEVSIYESDYDALDLELLNADSSLYNFKPDFVILIFAHQKLKQQYFKDGAALSDRFLTKIESYLGAIKASLNAKVIINNMIPPFDPVFGNFGLKIGHSFASQVSKLNFQLEQLSQTVASLHLLDLRGIQQQFAYKEVLNHDFLES